MSRCLHNFATVQLDLTLRPNARFSCRGEFKQNFILLQNFKEATNLKITAAPPRSESKRLLCAGRVAICELLFSCHLLRTHSF